ncbi:MAG TPA: LacI family DNA-binding transcriptional regulator [Trebonia sp.]
MREVADAAGVSTATVSRVLSGVQTVDPKLAARVRAEAERLGYRANRVARALRRQSTQTVGLVVPDLTNPFFPAVVQAVERRLRTLGLSLLLCDAGNDVAIEADLVRGLFDHQIDGLLISACDQAASRPAIRFAASRAPLVQIDRRAADDVAYAGVDQAAGMRQIVDHLRAQGCRTFAYISSHPEISTARERLEEFLRLARPLDPGTGDRVFLGDFSLDWGHQAAVRIVGAGALPDAIVCANDLIAIGALQALRERGISVPGDVAVTGFDDTVLAIASDPGLTTVRQPLEELGGRAATALHEVIADPGLPPRSFVLPSSLVVRASSRLDTARRPHAPSPPRPDLSTSSPG